MSVVLITGSRTWDDPDRIHRALLWTVQKLGEPLTVRHGQCRRGADAIAQAWALEQYHAGLSVHNDPHPAKWHDFGKRAGYLRNAEMVKLGADLCIAFSRDDSSGTFNAVQLAKAAGIPVWFIDYDLPTPPPPISEMAHHHP